MNPKLQEIIMYIKCKCGILIQDCAQCPGGEFREVPTSPSPPPTPVSAEPGGGEWWTGKIAVPEHMILSAVRYALGRRTYIVDDTVNVVLRIWPQISGRLQALIVRDINEAKARDGLGDACDREDWLKVLDRASHPAGPDQQSHMGTEDGAIPTEADSEEKL